MIDTIKYLWNLSLIKVYEVKDLVSDSSFGMAWIYELLLIHGDNGVLAPEAKLYVDPFLKSVTWLVGVIFFILRAKSIRSKNQKINAERLKIEQEAETTRIDNQIKLEEHELFKNLITEIRDLQKEGKEEIIRKKLDEITEATNIEHNLRLELEKLKNGKEA